MNWKLPIVLGATALMFACGGKDSNSDGAERSKEPATTIQKTEQSEVSSSDADAYYKPFEVFEKIGGVGGKVVADLAPGDGYFVRKMLKAGARVIAVCDSEKEADLIRTNTKDLNIADGDLNVRVRGASISGLAIDEVDIAFLSTGFASLDDPVVFAKDVFKGLRKGGLYTALIWKPIDTPIGPAASKRIPFDAAMDIADAAGYTDISGLTKLLPYHNLLVATEYLVEEPS